MTTTKKKLIELYKAFETCVSKGNINFRLNIMRNRDKIMNEINCLKEIEKEIESIVEEYNNDYYSIIREYGKEVNDNYIIEKEDPNYEKANELIQELQEKWEKEISQYKQQQKEYQQELLNETELGIEFIEIQEENIPDSIAANELTILYEFKIIK